jgi:hypothetical protein
MKYLVAVVLIFITFKLIFFGIDFLADIIGGWNTFLVLLASGTAFGFYVNNAIHGKPTPAVKEPA